MKANHRQYFASWKLFLGILLVAGVLAAAAHAGALFTGTFTLTNNVHWGQAVLPPGDYSFTLDQATDTIVIRDLAADKIVAREFARIDSTNVSDDSKLLVRVQGKHRVVYSVQVAGWGEIYNRANPFGTRGGGVEEARNTEAVRIEVAQK
ncbi:MAG: hypothetical protein LAN59_08720 [Acidobacteriia bacterium]|nr:hypothetical protein [Terriglobia bacterium]